MLTTKKIPIVQFNGIGVFDKSRVKDVKAVKVGNSTCVTMIIDDTQQIYTADPLMMEYLANTYEGDLDIIRTIKADHSIYEQAPRFKLKF